MFYQPALDAATVPLYPAALRAEECPYGLLSPSLPSLNPTQKHTAQLTGLRTAYALTFARRAPAPSPPLIAVGPVRETPHLPATLATADAATVPLYPAGPVAAAAFRTAGLLAYAALCTTPPSPRYIRLALLSLARLSQPPTASPGLTASPCRCHVKALWEASSRRRRPSRVMINNPSFLTISFFKRKPNQKSTSRVSQRTRCTSHERSARCSTTRWKFVLAENFDAGRS